MYYLYNDEPSCFCRLFMYLNPSSVCSKITTHPSSVPACTSGNVTRIFSGIQFLKMNTQFEYNSTKSMMKGSLSGIFELRRIFTEQEKDHPLCIHWLGMLFFFLHSTHTTKPSYTSYTRCKVNIHTYGQSPVRRYASLTTYRDHCVTFTE